MNWFQRLFVKAKEASEICHVSPFTVNRADFRFSEERNCPQVFLYSSVPFRNLDTNEQVRFAGIWVDINDESVSYDSYFVLIHPEFPNLKSYAVGDSYNYETYKVFSNLYNKKVKQK